MLPGAEVLAHEASGTGPLAVYGHGLFFSRKVEERLGFLDWSPLVDAGLRLVRYDARGHGQSPGRPSPEHYTFEQHGANLLSLLDHLKTARPVHGLGSSLGSAALLWAALTAPSRFDRLVLVVPPRAWENRLITAQLYQQWADQIDRDGTEDWLATLRSVAPPAILAEVREYPPTPDIAPEVLSSVLRGVASSDLPAAEKLSRLDHPTLILAWETDPAHPVLTAERLAQTMPHARLEVARTLDDVRNWGKRAATFLV
jgi:3-oxoadipate enol-lactonase